jgi:hypothetical protein
MKAWNFKVKSNPQEIIKKLDTALGSVNGFVFKMDHDKNDSVIFKVRKRDVYLYHFHNNIIARGKAIETGIKNESNVEISFNQHFSIILYVSIYLVLGLLGIISGIIYSTYMFIFGGILFVIGIAVLIDFQKRFEKNIQKYKALISEILEL